MIAEVIGVDAIEHCDAPCRRRDRREQPVQFPFAGVAPLLGVAGIGQIGQFRRGDLLVTDP